MVLNPNLSFDQFQQLTGKGNVIPIAASMLADCTTPVLAFRQLSREHRTGFLLESVEGSGKIARYSFMGFSPRQVYRYRRPQLEILAVNNCERQQLSIFDGLQSFRKRYRPALSAADLRRLGMPRFTGGLVGFIGYDCVRDLERIPERRAASGAPEAPEFPDAEFGFYDTILAFDHVRRQIIIIANVLLDDGELNLRGRYEEALARIELVRQQLAQPLGNDPVTYRPPVDPRAGLRREEFAGMVERAQEHIRAGDIFQAVLSQRFQTSISVDPFSIYRALRVINPSPYLYFLKNDDACLLGSSPEALLRVEEGIAELRPIAGTRRRGDDEPEDRQLAGELINDAKERAEHLMLVDLGRNDLGRVCEYGSVEVTELMAIEKYSHVMHLVSNVRGRLLPDQDAVDALRACFPAGTVSGAPKIRAMEIINELEMQARGPYAGAVGYLDFSGNLDTCITIRSMWVRDGVACFQAGAGIVADSQPLNEYQETIEKSRAVWNAIDLAERGLGALA